MKDSCGDCTMNIILLGQPGAGKGTQARLLSATLDVRHIASGDIFRRKTGDPSLRKEMDHYMNNGLLVPDVLANKIVFEELIDKTEGPGFLLDGYPRSLSQAEALNETLTKYKLTINVVVYLQVPTAQLINRLQGRLLCPDCNRAYHRDLFPPKNNFECAYCGGAIVQRDDDKPKAVEKRLEVYDVETQPLIDYYQSFGILNHVEGTGTPEEVVTRILETIKVTR